MSSTEVTQLLDAFEDGDDEPEDEMEDDESENEMEDDLDVTANIKADDKTLEMPRDKDGARAR